MKPAPAVPDDVLRALLKHNEELFAAYRARTAVPAVPAVREPLSEEWIAQFCMDVSLGYTQTEAMVRHVERAHGITGGSNE